MKGKKALRAFFRIALPLLTLACLFYTFFNSLHASKNTPTVTQTVTSTVSKVVQAVAPDTVTKSKVSYISAKIGHAGEFALFAFFLSAAALQRRKTAKGLFFQVVAVSLFSAVTDEYLQSGSAGRTPAITDVVIDLAGALIGLGAALLLGFFFLRRRAGKKTGSP